MLLDLTMARNYQEDLGQELSAVMEETAAGSFCITDQRTRHHCLRGAFHCSCQSRQKSLAGAKYAEVQTSSRQCVPCQIR